MKAATWFVRIVTLLLLCVACHRHHAVIREVPPDIIPSVPCPTLYSRILELFPEHVKETGRVFFADTVQKKIVLTKQSDVYVTFISEGAGFRNSFGWYSYDVNSPPTSDESLEFNILFPDVSVTVLNSGDKLKVGNFSAGTVIGFFLIVDGWQSGTIDYTKPKLYTDYNFNPEGQQQHILFEEKTCGDIVLAFEDVLLSNGSDKDFNDILFTVSDNDSEKANTAFDIKQIVVF